jgi:hypothetical protein
MRDYDTWILTVPQDEEHEIGIEAGEQCGRFCEPCEDAPRNYRPRPCGGLMVEDKHGDVTCESCGEVA